MEGERRLLSNHADIEATINNATEHFLFEESFREDPGGYYHIWAIWVCAAVKGMVFKQFTLG